MDWFLYDNGLRHERVNVLYWNRNIAGSSPTTYLAGNRFSSTTTTTTTTTTWPSHRQLWTTL